MARNGNAEAPQRSCLACRTTRDKDQLIRFVVAPGDEVLPDLESRLPGRGAYTCNDARCLATAVARQQFKRAFKCDLKVMPADQLVAHIRKQMHDRIIGLIGLANKAGQVTGGGSLVSEALKGRSKPGLVIIASDVSPAIGEKIKHGAASHAVPYRMVAEKDDFGAVLGKAPRSALAIHAGGFCAQLLKVIDRYRNFLGEV